MHPFIPTHGFKVCMVVWSHVVILHTSLLSLFCSAHQLLGRGFALQHFCRVVNSVRINKFKVISDLYYDSWNLLVQAEMVRLIRTEDITVRMSWNKCFRRVSCMLLIQMHRVTNYIIETDDYIQMMILYQKFHGENTTGTSQLLAWLF